MAIRSFSQVQSATLSFDILIVGSGPAGLALATEFNGTDFKVAVLESGGMQPEAATSALGEFENVGQQRAVHSDVGCRSFGGTSLLWTGRCGEFDAIDYHDRPWVPFSGWPIETADLSKYYQKAGTFLGIKPTIPAEIGMRELGQRFDDPPFDEALFKPAIWQFSKSDNPGASAIRHFTPDEGAPNELLHHTGATPAVNVGVRTKDAFEASENVHVFTYATVSELLVDAVGGRITGTKVFTAEGDLVEVKAPIVVLACGGIQNPRILLASRSQNPDGLGNEHDQVGRYLTDHHFTQIATFHKGAGDKLRRRMANRWHPNVSRNHIFNVGLRLSEQVQRREGLLNASIHWLEFGSVLNPLSTLAKGVRNLKKGEYRNAIGHIAGVAGRPAGLIAAAYDRMIARRPPLNTPERTVFGCVPEQELQPDSRVSLSERMDQFGRPRARVDWRIAESEFRTVRFVEEAFSAEASRLGFGQHDRPNWANGDFDAWTKDLIDLAHPSCSTRMSQDPSKGVVDANCEVHSVGGLYIAGSSVFPSNGYMNPTQTLVALSIRLADHIKTEARKKAPAATARPTSRMRVGFVGGGHRVQTIYAPVMNALSEKIEVCGVVTRSKEGADKIAHDTGWAATTDLSAFIEGERPDLLIASIPPDAIPGVYPSLVDRGIPLLFETPICWKEDAGRRLIKKIKDRGLLVGVAEQLPFMPEAQLQKKLISLGLIGKVATTVNDFAVFDYHGIGLLRALLGHDRRPVSAQATHLNISPDETWLSGAITFSDGSFLVHRYSPDYEKNTHRDAGTLKVYGTNGTLLPGEARFGQDAAPLISPIIRVEEAGDLKSLHVETPDGIVRWTNPIAGHGLNDEQVAVGCLVKGMVEAVQYAGVAPYPAWLALEDMELLNALRYSASRGGKTIRLPTSRLRQKLLIKSKTYMSSAMRRKAKSG